MTKNIDMFGLLPHKSGPETAEVVEVSVIKYLMIKLEEWSQPWGVAEGPRHTTTEQFELKMKTDKSEKVKVLCLPRGVPS